ncbi:muramoyltetrapeptide carboxypeptidase [Pantoea sp. BAV 3049]|uniref:muramoyltetrapeptide carboxypeptidase n=1 Tax=Pantoea sp. BAV 3049 TaxID=2654188 RepID=UPI00131D70C6|nr:muramoyltetrapeptide carboxypeptidase [Pantoea sp. BAV 3049]
MSITPRSFHLIAPSGYCHNQQAAQLAVERLRAQGHQVGNAKALLRREQRFAGSDAERLADLHQLIQPDCQPDIVLAVRGGYGATRLLPHFDATALAARLATHPLAICGHSDFTVIQLALLQQGAITFSGPMLAGNFGAEALSDFTVDHFWRALTSPKFTVEWQTERHEQQVDVSGRIWGGNLAMLVSLIGTPWMPQIDDGILVIEDVNEHPFRVERMLLQLAQSGLLARQKAIVTGSFTGAKLTDYDNGYDFDSVWTLIRQVTGLSLVTGLEFGHHWNTVTLPLGAQGHLQVNGTTSKLTLSGHPTLP